ncbi:MAG: CRISPR-associated helicase Cas3' [Candidatus Sigynarchaeota archaeon]
MASREATIIECIWGKSSLQGESFLVQPLLHHMLAAGCMAEALAKSAAFASASKCFCDALGIAREIPGSKVIGFGASSHDIGKCFPSFQASVPELAIPLKKEGLPFPQEYRWQDHAAGGWAWLFEDARSKYLVTELNWDRDAAWLLATCIRGHHGDFSSQRSREPNDLFAAWEPARRAIMARVESAFDAREWKIAATPPDMSVAGMLWTGFIVLADWLASKMIVPGTPPNPVDFLSYCRSRCEKIASSFFPGSGVDWSQLFKFRDVFPWLNNPRPLQLECEYIITHEPGPCLAIIEAPMGEGKTEAAIYLATRWASNLSLAGMYFALPTTGTSNQIHNRVREFLAKHSDPAACQVALVHGMRWLIDRSTYHKLGSFQSLHDAVIAHEWLRPSKRAILSAFGVGTIDQSLMAALKVKFGFLRVLGLASKVLIVDEVHAYDAYMSKILTLLLKWMAIMRVPVILLSATLPAYRKSSLLDAYAPSASANLPIESNEYPVITIASNNEVHAYPVKGCAQHTKITLCNHFGMLGNHDEIARIAVEASGRAGGKCVCVIVNTVAAAQDTFQKVHDACKNLDVSLYLFHARFPAGQRRRIEKLVLRAFGPKGTRRPRRAILVATQVVEQSLDIDFDEMISELAPIDLLLQRAGRLHRHKRHARPEEDVVRLHVALPAKPDYKLGKNNIYSAYRMLLTCSILMEREHIDLPGDIRPLVDTVYHAPERETVTNNIPPDRLIKARERLNAEEADEAGMATQYLIAVPEPHTFTLAEQQRAVFDDDEGEGGSISYLSAKTRIEKYPVQHVIFLDGSRDKKLIDLCRSEKMPSHRALRSLLLCSAPVPEAWLHDARPAKDFDRLDKIPWLRHHTLLVTHDQRWRGHYPNGDRVELCNDPVFGIFKIQPSK